MGIEFLTPEQAKVIFGPLQSSVGGVATYREFGAGDSVWEPCFNNDLTLRGYIRNGSLTDGKPTALPKRWMARMEDGYGNTVSIALSDFGGSIENSQHCDFTGAYRGGYLTTRKAITDAIIAGKEVSFTWEVNGAPYTGMRVVEVWYGA